MLDMRLRHAHSSVKSLRTAPSTSAPSGAPLATPRARTGALRPPQRFLEEVAFNRNGKRQHQEHTMLQGRHRPHVTAPRSRFSFHQQTPHVYCLRGRITVQQVSTTEDQFGTSLQNRYLSRSFLSSAKSFSGANSLVFRPILNEFSRCS
jgi:hypothetical protein